MCWSLTSSDSHGPSAHLYAFATYIQSVDGGNLAPLLQRRFLTAPCPLLNIGIENLQKQICSNDGNLAPPQTEQLPMLKKGVRGCIVKSWKMPILSVVQDFLHPQSLIRGLALRQETQVGHNNDPDGSGKLSHLTRKGLVSALTETDKT